MDPAPARSSEEKRLEVLRNAGVVLVSACLLGERCRYDGKDQRSEKVLRALDGKEVVPVCPEAAAGLGIPRPAVQLEGGDGAAVLDGSGRALIKDSGADRTAEFKTGAQVAVDAAQRFGASAAILKERSPSCGSRSVWVSGTLRPGQGVTACALERAAIPVVSDEEL